MRLRRATLVGAALITAGRVSAAQMNDSIITTTHRITVKGRPLGYIARVGRLPIRDAATGEPHGYMFFAAYHVQQAPGARPRPLTFLWNGGPGSPSAFIHLLGYGPRRVRTADDFPSDPRLGSEMVDNDDTWLDESDLVFIDPIGTGFSRATKPEYMAEFLQDVGDAQSIAEFIREYRQEFGVLDAPLLVGGESYGVSRAGRVADLLTRQGLDVAGVLLLTYDLPAVIVPNDVRRALALPTYTAAAFYHKKLPPDLQANLTEALAQSHKWSEEVYFPALMRRDSLTDQQRDAIIAQVSRFTGLKPSEIDRGTLTTTAAQYSVRLLEDQGLVIGRYDSRFTRTAKEPNAGELSGDPALRYINTLPGGAVLAKYFRNELGYRTDLAYAPALGQTFSAPRPRWTANGEEGRAESLAEARFEGRGGVTPPDTQRAGARRGTMSPFSDEVSPLRGALRADPHIKVFVLCSYYDLGANCIGDDYYSRWLGEPFTGRVFTRLVFSMHMPYVDKSERVKEKRDFAEFLRTIGL